MRESPADPLMWVSYFRIFLEWRRPLKARQRARFAQRSSVAGRLLAKSPGPRPPAAWSIPQRTAALQARPFAAVLGRIDRARHRAPVDPRFRRSPANRWAPDRLALRRRR